MPGWRNWFESGTSGSSFAHPDSPIGGTGPGVSRLPGPGNLGWRSSRLPHPDSPASHGFLWSLVLEAIDLEERAEAVHTAFGYAERELPRDVLDATGEDLHNLIHDALRGLLIALVIVAVPTAAGALIGGIFGVGAGAVAGGAIGLDVGLWILEYFGLGMLAGYVATSLYEAAALAREGGLIAWDSVDSPQVKDQQLRIAGGKMAQAATIIVRGILQGIVAFLVARGTAAAASRVPQLVNALNNSKLGAGFATWIENNWARLIENTKLREKPSGSGGGTDEEAPLARTPAKPEKAPPPPKQDQPPPPPPLSTRAVGDFSNLKGASPKQIRAAIPPNATKVPWQQVQGGAKYGSKFKWVDNNGNKWQLRMHGPDPSAPPGSNAANGWVVRVQKDNKYMGSNGNFYKNGAFNPNSPFYDPNAANDAHIPIQTPTSPSDYQ
jgi:hypothetical protein